MNEKTDPVLYTRRWSSAKPVDAPVKSESASACKALAAHAVLLYDNPTYKSLTLRDRNRKVRQQLFGYDAMLYYYGFILTTKVLKDAAMDFLRGFVVSNGLLTYELAPSVIATPMYRCARLLVGREITVGDRELVRYILSWLLFLSKLPLERSDLRKSAQSDWIDRQVKPLPIRAASQDIEAVRIIVRWLIDFEPSFVGNHGPGTVAGGYKRIPEKNFVYRPTVQTSLLTKYHVEDILYGLSDPEDAIWKDVYKDAGSLRPITMEPSAMQYAQQGMKWDWYYETDHNSDQPISRFVRYGDQTPSRDCAIRGSRLTRDRYKPSTIDLSAASDHLKVDLITQLFTGDLLHYIMLGRTWNVAVGKRRVELSMYAGMGSALTFPVQTTVFTACAIWATISQDYIENVGSYNSVHDVLLDYLAPTGFRLGLSKLERNIRVYGDDIAVPDFAAGRLFELLESFGLKVNIDKSFVGDSPVREACGMYALNGWDITPLRYRLPVQTGLVDGALYEASRQLANASFIAGYGQLYRAIVRNVRDDSKFISGKELRRSSRRGKSYADQQLADPTLLFEEWRGPDEDYIGFISMKESTPTVNLMAHERVSAVTTYAVEAVTQSDDQAEYYHLTVNYRQMSRPDSRSTEFHGALPRGIRLVKRNAIRRPKHASTTKTAWVWATR